MVFFPMVSHEPRSDERKSGVPKSADCHQPLLFEEARIGGGLTLPNSLQNLTYDADFNQSWNI